MSPSNSLSRRTTTTSSSGDYVSAAEDATETSARTVVSASELQRQRNKEQFDRLFGKVKRDGSNQRTHHSPMKVGSGVSLATILHDNGNRRNFEDAEMEPTNGLRNSQTVHSMAHTANDSGPVQSTLVS